MHCSRRFSCACFHYRAWPAQTHWFVLFLLSEIYYLQSARKRLPRPNLIGENRSKPALLNDPARLARLRAAHREKAEAEAAKEERKQKKLKKRAEKESKQQAKAASNREKAQREEPIVRVLVQCGYMQSADSSPSVLQMMEFMKRNRIKCMSAHPSREKIVSRLLSRLQEAEHVGGWLHSMHEEEDVVEQKQSARKRMRLISDSSSSDDSDNDQVADSSADKQLNNKSDQLTSAVNDASVCTSNHAPVQGNPRPQRVRRQRSFGRLGLVNSDANIDHVLV